LPSRRYCCRKWRANRVRRCCLAASTEAAAVVGVGAGGGADLDEDERVAVQGDQVEFADGTAVIAVQDAIAQALECRARRPLGAGAEPAPPPRFAGCGHGCHLNRLHHQGTKDTKEKTMSFLCVLCALVVPTSLLGLGRRFLLLGGLGGALAQAGRLADAVAQVVQLGAAHGRRSASPRPWRLFGECSGNVRSTPSFCTMRRTVNISRMPSPFMAMTTPLKIWTRSFSPSRMRWCTSTCRRW